MFIYLIVAFGPVLAIFFFLRAKDIYEKEPMKLLLIAAGVGMLSVIPVGIIEGLGRSIADVPSMSVRELAHMAFWEIAFVEETFKALAFFVVAYWNKHMNEPYDGIMYATSAALGFAAIENLMYVLMGGLGTGFIRAITAVPAHAMMGLLIGYFAGRAKFSKIPILKPFLIILGFTLAVLFHGTYDFIALWQVPFSGLLLVPLLILMLLTSLLLIKDAQKRSPFRAAYMLKQRLERLQRKRGSGIFSSAVFPPDKTSDAVDESPYLYASGGVEKLKDIPDNYLNGFEDVQPPDGESVDDSENT